MKSIYDIYETITDDDKTVISDTVRRTVTPEYVSKVMSECIPSMAQDAKHDIVINEDGTLKIRRFGYNVRRDGFVLVKDLPDTIKFTSFDADSDVVVVVRGDKVTTLKGLPEDLSYYELRVEDCPNLKDFGDVKRCKTLFIESTEEPSIDLSKIKRLPKADKFIRLIGCKDVDEKHISRISGVSKNRISIL